MKTQKTLKIAGTLLVMVAALFMAAAASFAVELAAVKAEAIMPDTTVVPMWGFIEVPDATTYDCPTVPVAWNNGPMLTATAGGALTVNVKNCLEDPVSVFIPGQFKTLAPATFQDPQGRARVRSFDAETPAGSVGTYIWTGLKEGTYFYHSGTHPQVQVQMGLYGALTVDGTEFPPVSQEEVLLYSEIDPGLHEAVDDGTYGSAQFPSTFDYWPRYFLINGKAYPQTTDININTDEDVLLRFINAGLQTHVPTLQGHYISVIAEDGNLYQHSKNQYSIELEPAKTMDAVLTAGTPGRYALYDRSLGLTNAGDSGGGMITYIQTVPPEGAPIAMDDSYSTNEDTELTVQLPGILDNDNTGSGSGPMVATLVLDTTAGSLTLNSDGSFNYTPDLDFNGTDIFTYTANNGGLDSNIASVRFSVIPVNDPPVANDDTGTTYLNTVLIINPVANDMDIDGNLDPSTTNINCSTCSRPSNGRLTRNADRSVTYQPNLGFSGVDSFVYEICDTDLECDTATVNITVSSDPPVNIPPFANDDTAQTAVGRDVVFSVTDNDVDADGSIDVTSVSITSGFLTLRGGNIFSNSDGTVRYTPPGGFRGTDFFRYTVDDNLGLTSNEATVRINVTN